MNFIGKWCKSKCVLNNDCNTCSETCFPRLRLADAVGCSEHLIWILMNEHEGKTHPEFADAIADYLGATSKERDSIVAQKHHGKYKRNPKRKFKTRRGPRVSHSAKTVVAIDKLGNVIKRYNSTMEAANQFGCSPPNIQNRCNKMRFTKDEFKPYGMSFRYADEWDALTPEERKLDIDIVKGVI